MSSGHLLYSTYSTTKESTSFRVSALLHSFNDHCRAKHAYELDIKEEVSGCKVDKDPLFALHLVSFEIFFLPGPRHVAGNDTWYSKISSLSL